MILGVQILPLDVESRVEGGIWPHNLEIGSGPMGVGEGRPVAAYGRLGIQVNLRDETGIYRHRLMPLGVSVELDGEEVYRLEQREFSFSVSRQMHLERVSRRWLCLYRREGNELPGRRESVSGATFHLPKDGTSHSLVLRSWDAAGNESAFEATLLAGDRESPQGPPPPPIEEPILLSSRSEGPAYRFLEMGFQAMMIGPKSVDYLPGGHLRLTMLEGTPTGAEGGPTVSPGNSSVIAGLISTGGGRSCMALIPWHRLESGTWRADLVSFDGAERVVFEKQTLLLGGDSGSVQLGNLTVGGGGDALYPGGALRLMAYDRPAGRGMPELPEGTEAVGEAFTVFSIGAAFKEVLHVELSVPSERESERPAGLFFKPSGRGGWYFVGAPGECSENRAGDGIVVGHIDRGGMVAPLIDLNPPYLGKFTSSRRRLQGDPPVLRPRETRERLGITLPEWPSIELGVVDKASGIGEDGLEVTLDGEPFPARWDPEDDRLRFDFWIDPGEGVHEIRVRAEDQLGNVSETSLSFELRR